MRHRKLNGMLTLVAAAVLAGQRSYAAIAQWVARVPQSLLAKTGSIRDRRGRFQAPSEPTIRRLLNAVDGHQVDPVTHREGAVIAQRQVAQKSNEVPSVREVVAAMELEGAIMTMDAMHTQTETAALIAERKGTTS